jgi:hypothetical protein
MSFKSLLYCLTVLCCLLFANGALAQSSFENVVEIDGVVMTADSLRAVGGAVVEVKNKNRGVYSEYTGVFSLVCYKGDTLEFSSIGFRSKEFIVPQNIKGQYFSLIQLMVQDTFYLPETIIRPLPGKGQFDYAFQHWRVPDDQYEMARHNTDAYILRALAYTLPRDGRESQSRLMAQQANQAVYYGQNPPMNILNPLAWGEFFEAWKRGDYRRSADNPYSNKNSLNY